MSKSETRKEAIKKTFEAMARNKVTIQNLKQMIANIEDKLNNQQFEIVRQTMLLKFDEIDETRQEFANAIALQDGHIDELEAQEKTKPRP